MAMDDNVDFGTLDNVPAARSEGAPAAGGAVGETRGKAAADKMVRDFTQALETNPNMKNNVSRLSDNVEISNVCYYSDKGGLVQTQKKTVDANGKEVAHKVAPAPEIVGYIIRNVGKEPIKYSDMVYKADPKGIFQGTLTQKTLAPGKSAAISKFYLTVLGISEEFSFVFRNGKIRRGSGKTQNNDWNSLVGIHYFTFSDKGVSVNSDDIKVSIATRKEVKRANGSIESTWVVKPEYIETFGYLNNPSEKMAREKKKSADNKNLSYQSAAYFMRQMVEASKK